VFSVTIAVVSHDSLPFEIEPAEVRRLLDSGEPVYLIDVREPEEHALSRIDGAQLIPMNTVPAAVQDLETKADDATLVVFCHHGMRSLNVVNWLRGQGISECTSMAGGIDRWSLEIDPAVPRY
jgi:rhodanese-related sulfurtransferase